MLISDMEGLSGPTELPFLSSLVKVGGLSLLIKFGTMPSTFLPFKAHPKITLMVCKVRVFPPDENRDILINVSGQSRSHELGAKSG
jgi:hypothetical protein